VGGAQASKISKAVATGGIGRTRFPPVSAGSCRMAQCTGFRPIMSSWPNRCRRP